jgi:hypothetical protein
LGGDLCDRASTYVDWRYLNGTQTAPASGLSAATFNLTMPTTVGTYVIRFYTGTSTLLATSQTVTVGTAAASVTVNPATIAPGGTVTATAAGGPANKTDWLALYPTGSTTYITWKYLNGTQTAPATGVSGAAVPFTMPTTTGSYTIKFWAGSTLLATSAPITVGSVPADASVTATPTTVGPLGTVSATIAGGPGNATDWVALYATGASTFVDWKYLNGTKTAPAAGLTGANLSFAVPATPGTYVLVLGRQHAARDQRDDHGRQPDDHREHGDGGAWRDRHRDGRERAGQSHRLDRHPRDGRIGLPRLEVPERHEDGAGRRPERRGRHLRDAGDAGQLHAEVLRRQRAPRDERRHRRAVGRGAA